jgi:hypothetical protein
VEISWRSGEAGDRGQESGVREKRDTHLATSGCRPERENRAGDAAGAEPSRTLAIVEVKDRARARARVGHLVLCSLQVKADTSGEVCHSEA